MTMILGLALRVCWVESARGNACIGDTGFSSSVDCSSDARIVVAIAASAAYVFEGNAGRSTHAELLST